MQLCAEFDSLHHLVSDALTNECVATPCCLPLIGECVANIRDGELCGGRIARMLTTSHMISEITEWEDQNLRGREGAGGLGGGGGGGDKTAAGKHITQPQHVSHNT